MSGGRLLMLLHMGGKWWICNRCMGVLQVHHFSIREAGELVAVTIFPALVTTGAGGWDRCRAEVTANGVRVTDGRSGVVLGEIVGMTGPRGDVWVCGAWRVSRARCACGGTVVLPP